MTAATLPTITDCDLEERAMRAYFRRFAPNCDQPMGGGAEVYEDDGVKYVRLNNYRGALATFEVVPLKSGGYRLRFVEPVV